MDFNSIFKKNYEASSWKKLLQKLFPNLEFYAQPISAELSDSQKKDAKSVYQFGEIELGDKARIQFYEIELQDGKNISRAISVFRS